MNFTRSCLRMRICFSLCSDTVMGCSHYNINLTCICLRMRIDASSLLLRYPDGLSFWYIYCTHICLRMRIDAFSLCSDTVTGWSWCYGDWTRICSRLRMMLFTHEIFFSLLRYRHGPKLVLHWLDSNLFAHAHDAFTHEIFFSLLRYRDGFELVLRLLNLHFVCACALMCFPFAQILWWSGAFTT